jgi:hypothetical protein
MAKARLLALLSMFWIGLALAGLLGHMVVDAAGSGCRINFESACQETQSAPGFQRLAENNPGTITLHAGIDIPVAISAVISPMLVLSLTVLILKPISINLIPPPLPPQ